MIHTVVYGTIAKADFSVIPLELAGDVSYALILAVKNFRLKHADTGDTVWIKCFFWKSHKEKLYPYLTKGSRVIVMGHLTWYPYLNRNQEPAVEVQLDVENVNLLFSKRSPDNPDNDISNETSSPQPQTTPPKPNIHDTFQSIYGTPAPSTPDLFSHATMAGSGDNELPF